MKNQSKSDLSNNSSERGFRSPYTNIMAVLSMVLVSFAGCQNSTGEQKIEKQKTGISELVQTATGTVEGEKRDGVYRFLGIPYAQNISGKNRFAPPQPIESWTGVYKANRFAQSSPQQAADPTGGSPVTPAFDPPSYVVSGDTCLALNVWTPENADGNLPVMVWLHGGGWTSGSGSCKIYDGENLASRGDVIVVTINHRLGASGLTDFSRVLGGDFAESSNLGIKDIVAALEWVQTNIKAFGGNPDLVTIFGESGGGWKVNTMLSIPSARGLFHRAIVESGPLTRFLTPEQADELALSVLNELGVSKDDPAALNNISFQDVLDAEAAVMSKIPMSFQAPGFPTGFWPVIDGELITDHAYDPKANESGIDVPLLIGQTATEFSLFMLGDKSAYSLDEAGLKQRVTMSFGEDNSSKVIETYKRDFPDYDPSGLWFKIFSDFAMGTLTTDILDKRSVSGAAPVYAYHFDWQTPIFDGKLYSPHTMEIPFVFDNVKTEAGKVMTGGGDEADALAKKVSNAWVEFAKTGKPAADGLPEWPAFSTEGRASMHLNTESYVGPYMDSSMVQLFHQILWSRI